MTMGYDRAITIFSPEGRILQVEYARQAVKSGSTAIGLVAKDGVVIVVDKRVHSRLVIDSSIEKIYIIDDHIISTFSGFIPDGRVLLEKARTIAQEYKFTFGSPIDMLSLVKDIGDYKQLFTQYGGLRPFGVSLIFAGIDNNKPRVFMTDPSGIYYEYKAIAVGEGENRLLSILEKEYTENMSIEEAISFGIKLLKEALDKDFDINRVNVAYIRIGEKPKILNRKDLKKYEKA